MGARESRQHSDAHTSNNHPLRSQQQIHVPPPPPRSNRAVTTSSAIPRKSRDKNNAPPPPSYSRRRVSDPTIPNDQSSSFLTNMRRKWSSSSHNAADVEPREKPRRSGDTNPSSSSSATGAVTTPRRSFLSSLFGRQQQHDGSHSSNGSTTASAFDSIRPTGSSSSTRGFTDFDSKEADFGMGGIPDYLCSDDPADSGTVQDIGRALAGLDDAHKEVVRVFQRTLPESAAAEHLPERSRVAQQVIRDVMFAFQVWHRNRLMANRDVQGQLVNLRHNLDMVVAYLRTYDDFAPFLERLPGPIAGVGRPSTLADGSLVLPSAPIAHTTRPSFDPTAYRILNNNEEVEEADVEGVVSFISEQLERDPHGVPRHPTFTYWDFKRAIRETKSLLDRIVDLLGIGLREHRATFNPLWVYLCSTALDKQSQERRDLSREIKEITCNLMLESKGEFTHKQRRFLKFCLAFCYPQRYDDLFYNLQEIARGIVSELQLPLIQYYNHMKETDSLLLDLVVPENCLYHGSKKKNKVGIQSQKDVLPSTLISDLDEWYQRERLTQGNEEKSIRFYEKWGFATKRIEKLRMKDGNAHGGRIVLNMFKQIAEELRPSFQHYMAFLYQENLSKLNYDQHNVPRDLDGFMPDDDRLYDVCGARAPCVKSISRALHKAVREFGTHPDPREAYILSYLRSVIVFRTERELNSFFQLLLKEFKGKIIGFYNGFSRDEVLMNESNVCRVVTMHVLYEHPNKRRSEMGRRMIVEIQMLLSRFFVVHRKLHLYHKVVRAKEQWAIGRDFSKMWDL